MRVEKRMPPMPGRPGRGPGGHQWMKGGEKAKDAKGTLLRVCKYMLSFKVMVPTVALLAILSTVATLAGTYLTKPIIDEMTNDTIDMGRIGAFLLLLAGLYIFSAASQGAQSVMLAVISQRTVQKVRAEMFEKMERLSVSYFDKNTHGELMSRMTNDVDTLSQTLSTTVTQLLSGIIMFTGTIVLMLKVSVPLSVVAFVTLPIMLLVTKFIAKKTRKYYSQQQAHLGSLNGHIEETISGQYAVKVFCHEKSVCDEFEERNRAYYDSAVKAQIYSGVIAPIMGMFNNSGYALTALAGGLLVAAGKFLFFEPLTIGSAVLFLSYSSQFSRPINEAANLFTTIQSALAGAERVFEVMDEPNEYLGEENNKELENVRGDVDINHIDFSYDGERPILKDVSIKAKQGQTVALVGPTGAGKTTIVNLLTRFYDVDAGEILIDGENIRLCKKDSVRKTIAIVLQDTHMFSVSVRENIRYGNLEASDEEVEYAARLANCHEFIERLPEGYDTVLTDDASNVSMGQRQLLAIARAMIANPEILILDEATSSVDTRTELKIQEAMKTLMTGRTSFVIAHRLSTIREADKIVVISDGKIAEEGTHKELLEKGGMYADLYNGQFNE